MVHIEPTFYLFAALMLLTLPLPWIGAAFLAAGFHELCHLATVCLLGGTLDTIRLDVGGAVIHARLTGKWAPAAASLAGPVGSLLLMMLCRSVPRIAVCGCIQGIFNLLPFRCLDGGRVLESLLQWLWPKQASRIMAAAERTAAVVLTPVCFYAGCVFSLGYWPFIWVTLLLSGWFPRKFPCKRR